MRSWIVSSLEALSITWTGVTIFPKSWRSEAMWSSYSSAAVKLKLALLLLLNVGGFAVMVVSGGAVSMVQLCVAGVG
ncbi:MAG: hypothetical protein HC869_03970 [Rhodospirillales bacterium]|nr:hypothetical protein [Rhodospirillales bacterium]